MAARPAVLAAAQPPKIIRDVKTLGAYGHNDVVNAAAVASLTLLPPLVTPSNLCAVRNQVQFLAAPATGNPGRRYWIPTSDTAHAYDADQLDRVTGLTALVVSNAGTGLLLDSSTGKLRVFFGSENSSPVDVTAPVAIAADGPDLWVLDKVSQNNYRLARVHVPAAPTLDLVPLTPSETFSLTTSGNAAVTSFRVHQLLETKGFAAFIQGTRVVYLTLNSPAWVLRTEEIQLTNPSRLFATADHLYILDGNHSGNDWLFLAEPKDVGAPTANIIGAHVKAVLDKHPQRLYFVTSPGSDEYDRLFYNPGSPASTEVVPIAPAATPVEITAIELHRHYVNGTGSQASEDRLYVLGLDDNSCRLWREDQGKLVKDYPFSNATTTGAVLCSVTGTWYDAGDNVQRASLLAFFARNASTGQWSAHLASQKATGPIDYLISEFPPDDILNILNYSPTDIVGTHMGDGRFAFSFIAKDSANDVRPWTWTWSTPSQMLVDATVTGQASAYTVALRK